MNADAAVLRGVAPAASSTTQPMPPLRRAGCWIGRRARVATAGVLALAAINLFFGLGRTKIPVFDEAYYGVIAAEMCDRHDWIRSTLLGQTDFWNLKPPLGYWLIGAGYRLVGFDRLAMRLPSAISAFATVALWMWLLRRWYGPAISVVAGALLAVAFPFVMQHTGRTGEVDAQLALVLTAALALWPGAIARPSRLYAIAVLLALGFLLKSFAIAPAIAVMAIDALASADRRRLRWRHVGGAALVFCVMPGLWAIERYRCDGTVFLARMVREDLFQRYTSDIDHCGSDWYGYWSSLFQRWHPGGVLILLALGAWAVDRLRRRGGGGLDRRARFLALWFVVPIVLYTCSRTQHKHYINPVYPAFVALAALSLRSLARRHLPRPAAVGIVALTLAGAALDESCILGVIHADLGPHPQDFLVRCRGGAIHPGDVIASTRPWTGVEAFILGVEDRARLRTVDANRTCDLAGGDLLLLDAGIEPPPCAEPVAGSADYALFRMRRTATLGPLRAVGTASQR